MLLPLVCEREVREMVDVTYMHVILFTLLWVWGGG